jgi:hypothetical protein
MISFDHATMFSKYLSDDFCGSGKYNTGVGRGIMVFKRCLHLILEPVKKCPFMTTGTYGCD